jgi:uncharacterized protein YkwD
MKASVRFCFLLSAIILLCAGSISAKPLTSAEILSLVNTDRAKHGLSALESNPTLDLAALAKAEDMVSRNYFAHVGPDGTDPWYWFKILGYNYTYAGENLAEGYNDAFDLENSWMASPTHRANILSPFYSEVGVAVVSRGDTNIIVQLFGSKENKVTLRR